MSKSNRTKSTAVFLLAGLSLLLATTVSADSDRDAGQGASRASQYMAKFAGGGEI